MVTGDPIDRAVRGTVSEYQESDDVPRTDLPPIARTIPTKPPKDFPEFDPARPETDFQLPQALLIARAMAAT